MNRSSHADDTDRVEELVAGLIAIDAVEGVPVDGEVRVAARAQQNAVLEVVEADGLIRALPPQVQAPPRVLRHVVQAAKNDLPNPSWEFTQQGLPCCLRNNKIFTRLCFFFTFCGE